MPFATSYREAYQVQLAFALLLRDRYAESDELLGDVMVKSNDAPAMRKTGTSGCFVFLNLNPGAHTLKVTTGPWTQFYRPVSIPVNVPAPPSKWPAYPDIALANPDLRLSDPAQPAPFRNQFTLASLLPTTQYPFGAGATLVRGRITSAGVPLANASVFTVGGDEIPYVTGASGEFVLFFEQSSGVPQTVTVRATHAGKPDTDLGVPVVRGATATADIDM